MFRGLQFSKRNYFAWFLGLLLISLFLLLGKVIGVPIRKNQLGYMLAETLMNYQFGFNRRALIGNLLLPFQNRPLLLFLITLLYCLCLTAPLALVWALAGPAKRRIACVGAFLVFCSPFGLALYIKDPLAIRKELFFFPFFFILIAYNRKSVVGNLLLILAGSLVHESFFFLFLPFLLGFHWLNQTASLRLLLLYGFAGTIITLLLSVLPGNSALITENFIRQYVQLGFEQHQFDGFAYFQKLPFWENIRNAREHLTGIIPFVYIFLYGITFWGLYKVAEVLLGTPHFKHPKRLMVCLAIILLMATLLFFIAMDYGRWLAMAFITSLILVVSQVQTPVLEGRFNPSLIQSATAVLWLAELLLVRVPHFTDPQFIPNEWFRVHSWFLLLALPAGGILFFLMRRTVHLAKDDREKAH